MNSWNGNDKGMFVAPGSVLGVKRSIYDHYGILMRDGDVIHYTSEGSDMSSSNEIRRTSFNRFLRGRDSFWTMRFPAKEKAARILDSRMNSMAAQSAGRFTPALGNLLSLVGRETVVKKALKKYRLYNTLQIQERAISKLGERRYNAVSRNCEHFAFWCSTGLAASQQVEAFLFGGVECIASFLSIGLFDSRAPGSRIPGRGGKFIPLFERSKTIHIPDEWSDLKVAEGRASTTGRGWNVSSPIDEFAVSRMNLEGGQR